VTGMQGCGVSTPNAAEVAEATVGLASEVHIPKGGMLTVGAKSEMLAAGVGQVGRLAVVATSEEGAAPKLHAITAPVVTSLDMT